MVNALAKDEFLVEHSGNYSIHNSPNFPEIDGIKGETELLTLADVIYKPDQLAKNMSVKQEIRQAYKDEGKQQEYEIILRALTNDSKTKVVQLMPLIRRSRDYTRSLMAEAPMDLGL